MAKSRAPSRRSINIWPGFVDALSTLVLVFVFALIIFAIGHDVLRQRQTDQINQIISSLKNITAVADSDEALPSDLERQDFLEKTDIDRLDRLIDELLEVVIVQHQSNQRIGSVKQELEQRLQDNYDQLEKTRDELALARIRNNELSEQLGQTSNDRQSLEDERSDNRALITDLRRQVTNLSGLSTTQKSEIDQLNRRNTELLSMLGQSEESDRARAQAVRELTATRQNLESQIATSESLMLDINRRLATLLQSYSDLASDDNEIAVLLSEDNLRNNLTSGVSATSALYSRITELVETTQTRLEVLVVARDQALGRLQEAQALAIENRVVLDQRTSALNSTIGELNSTQAALESAQALADQNQAVLKRTALDLDRTLGRLSSVQEALDAAQAELEATGQASASTIATLRTEMANAIAVRESQLDAAASEIIAKNRQIASQEENLLTAEAEIKTLTEQLFGASEDIAELMVAADQSAAELNRVQAERDAVSSDLVDAFERISASEAEVSMLAAELDNFARLRRILEEQVDSLRAERTTLAGDLDDLQDLTAQLQTDLTASQQAFRELGAGASLLEAANSAIEQQLSEAYQQLTEAQKQRDLAIADKEEIQLLREQDGIALIEAETRIEAVESRLAQVLSNMDTMTQKSQSEQRQLISQAQEIQVLETQLTNAEVSLALAERAQAEAEDKRRIAEESARIAAENLALAQQVDELEEFRSEFKGLLTKVVSGQQSVQQEGDRFTLPSEILFASGSSQLSPAGQREIRRLSDVLNDLALDIPENADWILRIDGHTDKVGSASANRELSSRRAQAVSTLLINRGFPPERIAVTGFGEHQPLDDSDTEAAYRLNRRIELSLSRR